MLVCLVHSGKKVVGLYFLSRILNGEIYSNFFENILPGLLEDITLQRATVWGNLGLLFSSWIERGGPIPWPSRSPDSTLIDF